MASTSLKTVGNTSIATSVAKAENKEESQPQMSGYDQLPNEMHGMRIRDEKPTICDEKVDLVMWAIPLLHICMDILLLYDEKAKFVVLIPILLNFPL